MSCVEALRCTCLLMLLMPLALVAQEPPISRSASCPGCAVPSVGWSPASGTPASRAALFEPLRLIDSATFEQRAEEPASPPSECLRVALVAGTGSIVETLSRSAWIDTWVPRERRPASYYLFAGSATFAWTAGHTAIRCYGAGRD